MDCRLTEGLLFPKKPQKKKRRRHHRSILQNKESGTCYLCGLLHDDWGRKPDLEEHHIFGGPDRILSEAYGLKVYLCQNHHLYGHEAVHYNRKIRLLLQQEGQQAFEREYPGKDFRKIFRKNYTGEKQ